MSDTVQTKRDGAILEVTLARPKANAIDAATSRAMGEVFAEFRDDPKLRVAILRGAGEKFFCAGWDMEAAAGGEAYDADYGAGGFGGITELPNLNKPVIAAVNGFAVGGGFELALSADLVVAADHAEFFLPEVFVGVLADAAAFRLPRRLPMQAAMEMLLTGRRLGAAEAMRWGLVNRVAAAAQLMDSARAMAADIVNAAPLAVAAVKEVVRATENLNTADCYALLRGGTLPAYQAMLHSEDAREGPRAFAEKRAPKWRGR
ncbi:MAG: enoyl-CoA hydratase-related protein [Gammaproteobacteria bacterium]|nr:enoyl-CoA hydratase-related protein [Gammaproteobacteria bacterium]MDD9815742.1 enoyl-CoA hydratase-related protein [Gammaproteobacteria bacterium]MDD9850998.1 enoyl-CoA hydratase-related protein [Gammaproteobacteria bacterium]